MAFEDYSIHIIFGKPVHLPLKRAYFEQDRTRGWSGHSNLYKKNLQNQTPSRGTGKILRHPAKLSWLTCLGPNLIENQRTS
jgi:hypothetical protein